MIKLKNLKPTPKELAKAAIRDIFIQMPTRTVQVAVWDGFKHFISETYGNESYNDAMQELYDEGWITKEPDVYRWKSYWDKDYFKK